ncbi:MAG: uL14 family ribosomal protein [Cloacibacillus evryensis]
MIQLRTVLNVADNSGAKKILCVQVKGGSFRKVGTVGDIIIGASVRRPNGNIKRATSLRPSSSGRKRDPPQGRFLRSFDDNAASS